MHVFLKGHLFKFFLRHFSNSSEMSSKIAAKAALRKEIAEKIQQLTPEEIKKQSQQVYEQLIGLAAFQNSKRVSTYLSIDTEIDTEPIVRQIFATGKECFVPRYSRVGMEMVKLHSMQDWEQLPATSWGIKQPSLKEHREDATQTGGLDLILVPGVAFTKGGLRLGHGGGYYDRFLNKIAEEQETPPVTIGLAFKQQMVAEVPVTDHDAKIDKVLCGK